MQDLKSELQERDDEIDAYKQVVGSLRDQVASMQEELERLRPSDHNGDVAATAMTTLGGGISQTPKKRLAAREEELASAREEFESIVSVLGSPVGNAEPSTDAPTQIALDSPARLLQVRGHLARSCSSVSEKSSV